MVVFFPLTRMEWFCSRALSQCVLLHFSILLVLGPACEFILSLTGARPSSSSSVLGHATQCQHIKADVAYTHRFVQVKFDDGDLFYRALMAEQTPTMAAMRERKDNKEWVVRTRQDDKTS